MADLTQAVVDGALNDGALIEEAVSDAGEARVGDARAGVSAFAWLLPIVWLLCLVVLVALVMVSWNWLPYLLIGSLVFGFVVWIIVSSLSPAIPDRTCPACREAGLVKFRRGLPGVRCELCEFIDEEMHVAYLDEW